MSNKSLSFYEKYIAPVLTAIFGAIFLYFLGCLIYFVVSKGIEENGSFVALLGQSFFDFSKILLWLFSVFVLYGLYELIKDKKWGKLLIKIFKVVLVIFFGGVFVWAMTGAEWWPPIIIGIWIGVFLRWYFVEHSKDE